MAITTNSAYASGTVSSVSGTTFTASGSTFASGDVGRCIYMLNGDAEGQTRKIVGYISGTVVTLDHAWDDSPIDGITEDEPSNGDTFFVSYFFDELDDGSNLIKHDQFCYELTSTWNASNTFVYDTNITFICNGANLNFSTSACLRLGDKTSDSFSSNGCNIFDTNSATFGWDSGDLGGDFQMYGGTFTGVNSGSFWRFQANDIRDCQIEFNGGGRFHGTNSKLVRNKFINCKTAVSPFTTRSPFGEISNNQVFACSASYYWYPLQSGSLTVTNAFGRDNDYAAIVSSVSSDTNQTLTFVDADFDTFTFSWIGSGGTNLRVREDYNYVPTILDQATQNPISSGRIYIENLAGTQIHNEALDGNGQVGELILRAGQYRRATGSTRTDETPHTIKVRCYGYLSQEFPIDIDARTVTNLSQIINNVVVANESTAGAYTGIAVNGSAETITISSDHTLQEIYDYIQWWLTQSANMQYEVPMTSADGNTFILAQNWDLICDGGDITSGTGKSLNFSGTGILQLNGNTANNVNVSSGDVHLESATDLTGMTIANDLRIDTGANSTLDFINMNVAGNVWNDDASHTLTINASNSSLTAGDAGTGNGQTNILVSSLLILTNLQNPTEVRVFEAGTTNEVAGQENVTTGTFSTVIQVNAVDISVLSLGYLNIKLKNVVTTSDRSIPIAQTADRQYENP
jgi:hypothetical protein